MNPRRRDAATPALIALVCALLAGLVLFVGWLLKVAREVGGGPW